MSKMGAWILENVELTEDEPTTEEEINETNGEK